MSYLDQSWFVKFMQLSLKTRQRVLKRFVVKSSILGSEVKEKDDEALRDLVGVAFGDGSNAAIENAFGKELLSGGLCGNELILDLVGYYLSARPFKISGDDLFSRLLCSNWFIADDFFNNINQADDEHKIPLCKTAIQRLLLTEEGQKATKELIRKGHHESGQYLELIETYAKLPDTPREHLGQIYNFFVAINGSAEIDRRNVGEEIMLLKKFV